MIFFPKVQKTYQIMDITWYPSTHSRYPGIGYQVNTRVSGTRVRVVQSLILSQCRCTSIGVTFSRRSAYYLPPTPQTGCYWNDSDGVKNHR